MYKYAIIGFGGLGKLLLTNLINLEHERRDFHLQAICGADPKTFTQNVKINIGDIDMSSMDFSDCNFYKDYKELIDTEELDFIISTLPTYLHEEVAVYALNKGINVFSEKPMALTVESCDRMIAAAKANNKKLMIGHCLRFNPAFAKLKEYVENETFGKPYRAEFMRYSQKPHWTWNNWILDSKLSGGAVLDLHIHDVDLINWIFGEPNSFHSAITEKKVERESIFTQYYYDDLLVLSSADWSFPKTFEFESRCIVNFEKATIVIDNEKFIGYQDDIVFKPDVMEENDYELEMRAMLEYFLDNIPCQQTSPESVRDSVRLALKEVEAARKV